MYGNYFIKGEVNLTNQGAANLNVVDSAFGSPINASNLVSNSDVLYFVLEDTGKYVIVFIVDRLNPLERASAINSARRFINLLTHLRQRSNVANPID